MWPLHSEARLLRGAKWLEVRCQVWPEDDPELASTRVGRATVRTQGQLRPLRDVQGCTALGTGQAHPGTGSWCWQSWHLERQPYQNDR